MHGTQTILCRQQQQPSLISSAHVENRVFDYCLCSEKRCINWAMRGNRRVFVALDTYVTNDNLSRPRYAPPKKNDSSGNRAAPKPLERFPTVRSPPTDCSVDGCGSLLRRPPPSPPSPYVMYVCSVTRLGLRLRAPSALASATRSRGVPSSACHRHVSADCIRKSPCRSLAPFDAIGMSYRWLTP